MQSKRSRYHGYRFPSDARTLKRRQGRLGDTWHLDEVFITINGQRQYLWRAVDQDGDVLDILVQPRRDQSAAERFFRKLLKSRGTEPRWLVTDRLRSYGAAHRVVMPSVNHNTGRYANNRAEVSHQLTRQRERQMRRFKSPSQAQRFCSVHGIIQNLFRAARHLLRPTQLPTATRSRFPCLAGSNNCPMNRESSNLQSTRNSSGQLQVDSAGGAASPTS
jgi:putative transposase